MLAIWWVPLSSKNSCPSVSEMFFYYYFTDNFFSSFLSTGILFRIPTIQIVQIYSLILSPSSFILPNLSFSFISFLSLHFFSVKFFQLSLWIPVIIHFMYESFHFSYHVLNFKFFLFSFILSWHPGFISQLQHFTSKTIKDSIICLSFFKIRLPNSLFHVSCFFFCFLSGGA